MARTPGDVRLLASGASLSIKFGGRAHAVVLVPLPDDHAVYGLLGLLAAEGARTENLLDRAIARLLGVDEDTAAGATGQLIGPGPRFASVQQLLHRRGEAGPLKTKADKLSSGAHKVFEPRNRALHDPWLVDKSDMTKVYQRVSRPRSQKKFGTVERSMEQLQADADRMREFRGAVTDLYNDIWEKFRV